MQKSLFKALIAELVGTFLIVFVVISVVFLKYKGTFPQGGIAISVGFVVTISIYIFGPISGAHFNPAVTIGLALSKYFSNKSILPYIIAQSLGASLASALQMVLFGKEICRVAITLPGGSLEHTFFLESFLTALLVLTIMFVTSYDKLKNLAGLIIGLVVTIGTSLGCSINPARSLGPALVSLKLDYVWLYWVAPLFGGFLAYLTDKMIILESIYTKYPNKNNL